MDSFCKYDVNSFEELVTNTRNKAIDDFVKEYKSCDNRSIQCKKFLNCADCIAEQLKAGEQMAVYFIADTHFGHQNALAFDNRKFKTIEEHDNALIENWNNAVGIDDEVFILGDISWHNVTKTIEIIKSLNGVKHLIVGNHDKKLLKNRELQSLFVEITDYKELSLPDGKGIVLCH